MARLLKQSTAITILMGPFVDVADGYTAKTALSPSVKVSKNGGAQAARSSATAITHDADGYYLVALDATDTGTLGRLRVTVAGSSSNLPVWEDFLIVPANVYDGLVGGSDVLQVDISQWNNSAIATPDTAGYPKVTVKAGTGTGELNVSGGKAPATVAAGDIANNAITAAAIAADAIGASELAADAVAEIAAAVAAPSAATIVSTLLGTTNTSNNDPTQVGGQIRRTHALSGGTKNTQDASATNAPIKARNEADSSNLVTVTPTESAGVTTWTPT